MDAWRISQLDVATWSEARSGERWAEVMDTVADMVLSKILKAGSSLITPPSRVSREDAS